jgi:hypothetical protein
VGATIRWSLGQVHTDPVARLEFIAVALGMSFKASVVSQLANDPPAFSGGAPLARAPTKHLAAKGKKCPCNPFDGPGFRSRFAQRRRSPQPISYFEQTRQTTICSERRTSADVLDIRCIAGKRSKTPADRDHNARFEQTFAREAFRPFNIRSLIAAALGFEACPPRTLSGKGDW